MTPTPRRRPPLNAARLVREIHLYAGVFFAPLILFFAATGALQVLGLHEASRDGRYIPPPVIEKLSEVHIHHRFAAKPKPPGKPAGEKPKPAGPAKPAKPKSPAGEVVKWLFVATALGLIASALLGLWMGFTQGRRRALAVVLFLIGAALPVVLLAL